MQQNAVHNIIVIRGFQLPRQLAWLPSGAGFRSITSKSARVNMNGRRSFLAGASAVALVGLSGCDKLKNAWTLATMNSGGKRWPDYHYRLAVEVETPEGVKHGSSVLRVSTAQAGPNQIPEPGITSIEAYGEAVAVDLGERGVLFALIRKESHYEWAERALINALPPIPTKQMRWMIDNDIDDLDWDMKRIARLPLDAEYPVSRYIKRTAMGAPTSGPPNGYPLLVRFRDLADPKSVERVDPDDLANSFGGGVTLKAITVARTEAKVTRGIERRLPWIDDLERYRTVKDNPFTNTLPQEISFLRSQ
jgi:hypothetical protein